MSTSAFSRAFAHTLGLEGGFSDHPADSGGATRFGITEKVARAFGYTGPMQQLPLELAKTIYREQYWNPLRLDEVAQMSEKVATELFDTSVNCGVGVAGRFLQRTLNALNRQRADYDDVTVDGRVGQLTITAFRQYMRARKSFGEIVLLRTLNGLQVAYYVELVERRDKDETFFFGWIRNRVGL